jgi:polysaccharide pyruvyl transferase WcaK-like protein
MIMSLVSALQKKTSEPIQVVARGGISAWSPIPGADLLGLPRGPLKLLTLLRAFRRARHVYIIGADCLDGHYSISGSVSLIRLADAAARMGATTTITGISFKDAPAPQAARALRRLTPDAKVLARDGRSAQRILRFSEKQCPVVADAAFMLQPAMPRSPEARALLSWVDSRRGDGKVVLGVNFSGEVLRQDPELVGRLHDVYACALDRLLSERPDVDIVLIPHDYRGPTSDVTHALSLAQRLERPDRVNVLAGHHRANEMKYVAGEMDAVLTGRMHLAIAALGCGVPVACITYQGKFEGLFEHFDLPPLMLDPVRVSETSLTNLLLDLIERRLELRDHVHDRLDRVISLSQANLA